MLVVVEKRKNKVVRGAPQEGLHDLAGNGAEETLF